MPTASWDHSLRDLRDLVRAKDQAIQDLAAAYREIPSPPDGSWETDFRALCHRYADAKAVARAEMRENNSFFVPDSAVSAEKGYQAIRRALSPTPDTVTPGSFQDLFSRMDLAMRRAVGHAQRSSPTPQPERDLSDEFMASPLTRGTSHFMDSVTSTARSMIPSKKNLVLLGILAAAGAGTALYLVSPKVTVRT